MGDVAIKEQPKCLPCGQYVSLGSGKVVHVIRTGGIDHYTCPRCVKRLLQKWFEAYGERLTYEQYVKHPIEMV